MSHLSTASEGEQGINSNHNNYYFYKSFSEEQKINKKNNIDKNNNENIYDSLKKGIKDIYDCQNSNKNYIISLSCYYYCDINMDEEDEIYLNNKIQQFVNNYKKKSKKEKIL